MERTNHLRLVGSNDQNRVNGAGRQKAALSREQRKDAGRELRALAVKYGNAPNLAVTLARLADLCERGVI